MLSGRKCNYNTHKDTASKLEMSVFITQFAKLSSLNSAFNGYLQAMKETDLGKKKWSFKSVFITWCFMSDSRWISFSWSPFKIYCQCTYLGMEFCRHGYFKGSVLAGLVQVSRLFPNSTRTFLNIHFFFCCSCTFWLFILAAQHKCVPFLINTI